MDELRAGWGRTRIAVESDDLVADVGSGAFPNPRANVLVDLHVHDDLHRNGTGLSFAGKPFTRADVCRLPFPDKSIDFVIVSHLAEHVDDPDAFCAELRRACKRGYIETPSPLGDRLLHEDYHLWRVGVRSGELRFVRKTQPSPLARRAGNLFYATYNAGLPRSRRTFSLPSGRVGRLLGRILWLVRGVGNRSGMLITRVEFGPDADLKWTVIDDA
ncbi:MAG: SAM-dependent methyltransferase [Acidimicrobiales bacterium]|jgi:SAM-dependent methyltransferase